MSKYKELRKESPVLNVKENPKEIMVKIISCMCDNVHHLRLKKNADNEFKLSGMGQSLSNFSFKCEPYEIEWAADEDDWDKVFKLINSGTSVIESVQSR